MNEVYAALYDKDMQEVIAPRSSRPDEFLKLISGRTMIVGDGVNKYREVIETSGKDFITGLPHQNYPLAATLISLMYFDRQIPEYDFSAIADLEPYYLRQSQAELKYQDNK